MRMKYLDGVRGLMAVIVLIHHFVIVFYPEFYYVDYGHPFAQSSWAAFVNGNVGVQYFFMLSGFLVVIKYSKKTATIGSVTKSIIRRYFRLLQIVFVGTFLAFFLMKTGAMTHLEIAHCLKSEETLLQYNNFNPSFWDALKVCLIDTFLKGNRYDGPLWTIRYEIKAYIILSLLMIVKKSRNKFYYKIIYYCLLVGVGVYFVNAPIVASFGGAILGELWLLYNSIDEKKTKLIYIYKIVAGLVGLFFATIPQKTAGIHYLLDLVPGGSNNTKRAFGVFLLFSVLLISPVLQHFFERGIFIFLGRISDMLYAIHWPVILSLGCTIFYSLVNTADYYISTAIAFGAVVAVSVCLSYITHQILSYGWKNKLIKFRG